VPNELTVVKIVNTVADLLARTQPVATVQINQVLDALVGMCSGPARVKILGVCMHFYEEIA